MAGSSGVQVCFVTIPLLSSGIKLKRCLCWGAAGIVREGGSRVWRPGETSTMEPCTACTMQQHASLAHELQRARGGLTTKVGATYQSLAGFLGCRLKHYPRPEAPTLAAAGCLPCRRAVCCPCSPAAQEHMLPRCARSRRPSCGAAAAGSLGHSSGDHTHATATRLANRRRAAMGYSTQQHLAS